MTSTSDSDTTRDAFLGGRVGARQPRRGYRAGVDAVLLAAAVPAQAGEAVLDLGCGVGVAALCLAARVPGVSVCGVEVQAEYAALARTNAAENGASVEVVEADLRSLPAAMRARSFDHVMMNPPYFDRASGTAARDAGREVAFGGDTPLSDWLTVGTRRLGPAGRLTLIQRVERLPEVLAGLPRTLGGVSVLPLSPREGRAPHLVLVTARKGARAAFRLHAAVAMHAGPRHLADGEDYAPEIAAVLRGGANLRIPP